MSSLVIFCVKTCIQSFDWKHLVMRKSQHFQASDSDTNLEPLDASR